MLAGQELEQTVEDFAAIKAGRKQSDRPCLRLVKASRCKNLLFGPFELGHVHLDGHGTDDLA